MKWNADKLCFTADDGSKLKPTKSLVHYTNQSYAKWCLDGLKGKEGTIVNNSHLWGYIHGRHNNSIVDSGLRSKGGTNV